MRKQIKNQKGLTLVELLAVLVILGIVAAIAIPMVGNIISDSKDKAILADAQQIISSAKLAYINNEHTNNVVNEDILSKYVDGVNLENATVQLITSGTNPGWLITWSRFSEITSEEIKKAIKLDTVSNKAYEEDIVKFLSGE